MITLTTQAELTLDAARVRLRTPLRRDSVLTMLMAASLAATAALALAGAVILGPPGRGTAQAVDVLALSR